MILPQLMATRLTEHFSINPEEVGDCAGPLEWKLLMVKTLCKISCKSRKDHKKFKLLVCEPTHLCSKCGRAANDKKLLCKPQKLKC